ncbi:hypothetical protein OG604_49855 [Streptomyces sp. NBC_01231]|nr:hypothetical protein OG604_49855 [Streptomyces sp. NBC_01231]
MRRRNRSPRDLYPWGRPATRSGRRRGGSALRARDTETALELFAAHRRHAVDVVTGTTDPSYSHTDGARQA